MRRAEPDFRELSNKTLARRRRDRSAAVLAGVALHQRKKLVDHAIEVSRRQQDMQLARPGVFDDLCDNGDGVVTEVLQAAALNAFGDVDTFMRRTAKEQRLVE